MSPPLLAYESSASYAPTYVLDASVALKWFVDEPGTIAAKRLKDECLQGRRRLIAPSLLAIEVANALRYQKSLGQEDVDGALADLADMPIVWIEFTLAGLRRLAKLARDRNIAVYDAVYVYLASEEQMPLVTADEELRKRCAGMPLVISLADLYPGPH